MPAQPNQKNQDLQALRFWALFFVILHHLPITKAYLPAFLTSGWTSVDLFFAISGFVIYKNFSSDLKKEGSFFEALQYFYIKRVFRILPLVSIYIFCVAYFVYFNREQYPQWQLNHVFGFLISSFSFTTNYGIYLGLPTPAEALHLWSLNVEEHFYLLFPWSFYFFTQKKSRILFYVGVMALTAFVIRQVFPIGGMSMRQLTHFRLDAILFGVLLYEASTYLKYKPQFKSLNLFTLHLLALTLLIILMAMPWGMGENIYSYRIGLLLAPILSVFLVYFGTWEINLFAFGSKTVSKVFSYLGERTYGYYLFHILIYQMIGLLQLSILKNPLVYLSVYFMTLYVVVEILHQYIEKPLIRFSKNLTPIKAQPALAVVNG